MATAVVDKVLTTEVDTTASLVVVNTSTETALATVEETGVIFST